MNKFQKEAYLMLATSTLMLGFGINLAIEILSSGTHICAVIKIWALLIIPVGLAGLIYGLRDIFSVKKQGTPKIDYDERDHLIWRKAALAAFASVGVALAAASVIPQYIVGQTGSVPAWLLPIINFAVAIVGTLVYSVAILVQYGFKEKKNE